MVWAESFEFRASSSDVSLGGTNATPGMGGLVLALQRTSRVSERVNRPNILDTLRLDILARGAANVGTLSDADEDRDASCSGVWGAYQTPVRLSASCMAASSKAANTGIMTTTLVGFICSPVRAIGLWLRANFLDLTCRRHYEHMGYQRRAKNLLRIGLSTRLSYASFANPRSLLPSHQCD